MWFKTYFLDVLFKHYADFKGRATRTQYWLWALACFLIGLAPVLIDTLLGFDWGSSISGPFSAIYSIILFLPGWAIYVRRLHDINKSGWWVFLPLVPIIIAIIVFVFMTAAEYSSGLRGGFNSSDTLISTVGVLFIGLIIFFFVSFIILFVFSLLPSKEPNRWK